jgi:transposase
VDHDPAAGWITSKPPPKMKEYRGSVGRLGTELVTLSERMFRWWHRVRDGTLTRTAFRRKMAPVRERVEWLILDGTRTRVKAVRAMCWELHRLSDAMWTFIDVEGIDPTNNAAERAVRAAVLWRKCSYGTHSEAGGVFAQRMLTVTASLRMQGRNVLAYLTHAVEASLTGQAAPSLLPGRDHVMPLAAAA